MTPRNQKMYQNITKWRNLPKSERRQISHATVVDRVANSMAMENEPVSKEWLKKNSR